MSDAKLPNPVRTVLRDEADEVQIQRMWQNIDAGERRTSRVWPVAGGLLGAAAMVALAFVVLSSDGSSTPGGPGEAGAGPLRLADGRPLAVSREGVTQLSDGSQLTTHGKSELEVLDNSNSTVSLALRNGRVSFSVKPGGPRTWRIESGPLTVEVVGTVFSVERSGARVTVAVERGAVLVRGEGVPDRVRRLTAGEQISVGGSKQVSAALSVPPTQPAVNEAPDVAAPALAPVPGPAPDDAVETVDELLREVDRLRKSGDHQASVAPLLRIVRDHSDDEQAAVAAVTLGRVYLDALSDAKNAAWAFERALDIGGLPDVLEEQARERLVSALTKAGEPERAAEAEKQLRQRFPNTRSEPR